MHKPENFNEDAVCVFCGCLSTHGPHSERESFFGNCGVHLDSRRVNVFVRVFVCSCMRKETKIEAAHWVQAHAYA